MNKKKRFSPFSKEFYIQKGMSEKDAILEAKSKRPCNKEYWLKKGFSEEEAKLKISSSQRKKTKKLNDMKKEDFSLDTTKIEYWLKHTNGDEELAHKLLADRQSTFSKEKCIKRYGEKKGMVKWLERQKKWIKTLNENNNMDVVNAKKAITLDLMIDKYGEIEGKEKYNNWKNSIVNSEDNFIKRYGKNGKNKYQEYLESLKGRFTLEWYINKYGKEKGEIGYYERCNKLGVFLEKYIEKYGELEGNKKYEEYLEKRTVSFGKASKKSLEVFTPFYEWLIEVKNVRPTNILLGIDGSKELRIYHIDRLFLYDFCLIEEKLIFEFHGKAFHPNENILSEKEMLYWKHPFSNLSASDILEKDLFKKKVALKNGYQLFEIYEDDNTDYNLQRLKEIYELYS